MSANALQHRSGWDVPAADVATGLDRGAAGRLPAGADFDHRLDPSPLLFSLQVVQALGVCNGPTLPGFQTSVALVQGPGRSHEVLPQSRIVPPPGKDPGHDHRADPELTLVLLYCQHIVGPGLHDLFRYLPLTSHGVDGHDAFVERQESQRLGNGGDLVGLPLHPDLAQRHAVGRCQRAYQVNGLLAPGPVVGAAHRLTVNGHHFTLGQSGHLLGPPHKTALELLRVQTREHVAESVVGWDAVG